MDQLHKAFPENWIFADCPADGACINPSIYAVVGAASALGGVTRMTISLVRLASSLCMQIKLTNPAILYRSSSFSSSRAPSTL